jgi:gas vesicle protein
MSGKQAETVGLFITGTLLGVAVGFLYAPQSGSRTRKQIRKHARRSIEHLDELQDDIRSQVIGWVQDVNDVVDEGMHQGRRITLAGQEKVLGAFDDAKQYVDEGRTRIERLMGSEQ